MAAKAAAWVTVVPVAQVMFDEPTEGVQVMVLPSTSVPMVLDSVAVITPVVATEAAVTSFVGVNAGTPEPAVISAAVFPQPERVAPAAAPFS